ncbi:MAG: SDR family NAD(P)-dependent oxidoreductase [Actinomycetota bacterium]|nr:SDR family NAD(P)-dependent oxidoreductase [Actinomycetota bacterium]
MSGGTNEGEQVTAGRMAGRRALVTGGASGIGLATIRRLLAEGAEVVAVDRREPAAGAGAGAGADRPCPYLMADVTSADEVGAAVAEAAGLLGGPPDVLVNAAGVYPIRPLLDLSQQEWDETLAINLRGTFTVSQAVARRLVAAGLPGAIVSLGSTAALVADAAEPTAHYNASKAGVLALTRQMAVEWAPYQIRANAVCPGVIDTPMLRLMDDPAAGQAYLDTGVPLRRLGTAAEVAAVIVFLASADAAYVTGVAIPVDGGSTAI